MTPRRFRPVFSVFCSAVFCNAVLCSLLGGCSPAVTTDSAGVSSSTGDAPAVQPEWEPEPGFQLLTLSDFSPFPQEANGWTEQAGVIRATGVPRSYLFTNADYSHFTLRCELRFPEVVPVPGAKPVVPNTGVLVYLTEPHRVWPISLEVQGKYAELGSIRPNGGVLAPVLHDDEAFRLSQRKPLTEWNLLEIESLGGALRVLLGGVEVSRSEATAIPNGTRLSTGKLGLQAEGAAYEIRRLRIRTDPVRNQ